MGTSSHKDTETRILDDIKNAADARALDAVRVAALGRKGEIALLLRGLSALPDAEKRKEGAALNTLKDKIAHAIETRKSALDKDAIAETLRTQTSDATLPAQEAPLLTGRIHPLSRALDASIAIFADLGFDIAEGPEIETDYYNFTALNIPEAHPARQMHDTFYFDDGSLLRTHTSPVQIHTMEGAQPPFRFIAPGRVYRRDSDQTHTPMFHQIEGVAIGDDIHMGHLRWALEEFLRRFFELDRVRLRFRPSYFPFTEPSIEVDVGCDRRGNELILGEGEDWLEVAGAGMVHPNVLKATGHDPARVQGFAFGLGIDRLALLKYGIPDLRAFFDADMRWLKHYGFTALDALAGGSKP